MFKNELYEYNKKYETFCVQNCINYILQTNKIENAEFYINKSMSIVVDKKSKEQMLSFYDKYCNGVVPEYSKNVKSHWSSGDVEDVFKENVDAIKNRRQIIVGVDSFYLPYMPFYENSHGVHSVVFKEYDEKGQRVRLIDKVEPWCFDGYISLEVFLKARNSLNEDDGGMFCGLPINNRWKEILLNGWDADLDSLIKKQINLTLEQYYFPKNHGDETVKGIDALMYIKDCLGKLVDLTEEMQEKLFLGVHRAFYRLNHRRKFWSDFLDKIPKKYCTEIFSEYVEEVCSFEKQWDDLLFKILMMKMKKKINLVDGICERINELVLLERKSGERLLEYAEYIEKRFR